MNMYCRLICLASLALPGLAGADEALRFYQTQQREQEQRWVDQHLRQLQRTPDAPVSLSEVSSSQDEACWRVTGMAVSGNERLGDGRIAAATAPLMRPCMGVAHINALLRAITTLYLEAGYLASRPYLASQPRDGQALDIIIVEGFVEAIEVSDPTLPLSLSSAFPGMLGEPLQLRDLEQGMDQLNRLQAFDLTATIEPGEYEGGSRLLLQPRSRPSRWKLRGGLDDHDGGNYGSRMAWLGASLDSPLHLNDYLALSHKRSLANARGRTHLSSIDYQVPFGAWSLGLHADQLRYQAPISGLELAMTGTVATQQIKVERTLWRDGRRLLSGHLQWAHKSALNSISDLNIAIQASELSVAEIGLSGLWLDDGLWTAALAYSHGLEGHALRPGAPQPRFEKYSAAIGRTRYGRTLGQPWSLNTRLGMQYSPNRLPSLASMQVGGAASVRGFRRQTFSAPTAVVWNAQLGVPLALGTGLKLTPSLGLDLGWARQHPRDIARHQAPQRRLAAVNVGASLRWRETQLRLTYQRALHDSRNARLEPGFWNTELSFAL